MKVAESLDFSGVVADLRATFNTGKTKDLEWRKQQLRQMQLMIKENYAEMCDAFRLDHGGPKIRAFFEVAPYVAAGHAISQLDKWAQDVIVPHKGGNPLESLNGKSYIRKEPKGVFLIICPWNYPILLTLDCMIGAIAAGNCCVVKVGEAAINRLNQALTHEIQPSEVSANSCKIMEKLFPKYFDQSCIRVVSGGVAEVSNFSVLHKRGLI